MNGESVENRLQRKLDIRTKELRAAYNLMHQARGEREVLRERLVSMTRAIPGEWKLTKDGCKRYRKWEYPHSRSIWRPESESIDDMEMVILPPPDAVHGQLYGTDTVITGYADDDELEVM